MADKLIDLGAGAWTIRGSFKLFGLLDIGTQAALIKLGPGRFIFLDSYTLTGALREEVMALTDDGRAVEAVLNVHPFHTLHCAQMAQDFPNATFYGSERHARVVPEVTWAPELVESAEVAARYPELAFSMPAGVAYIHANEKIHAGSLLVFHRPSGMLHVDDTFMVWPTPAWLRRLQGKPKLAFHPTLRKALDDTPGAGAAFCAWADGIARDWAETRVLCAAHSRMARFGPGDFTLDLRRALEQARPKLEAARGS